MKNTAKNFELPCLDWRKSFYGKARVIVSDDGARTLQSYNTAVCKLDANGHFVRLWSGYSATTMRHVNSFLRFYGADGGGKTWWDAQKVG